MRASRLAGAALLVGTCACGGGADRGPTTPTPGGGTGNPTITITAAGVSPREITISPGQRVSFTNNDSRQHEMTSDPHPTHTDCPEINQVGQLRVGQTKESGNFVTPQTCGYHDHGLPNETSLKGRIVVR